MDVFRGNPADFRNVDIVFYRVDFGEIESSHGVQLLPFLFQNNWNWFLGGLFSRRYQWLALVGVDDCMVFGNDSVLFKPLSLVSHEREANTVAFSLSNDHKATNF